MNVTPNNLDPLPRALDHRRGRNPGRRRRIGDHVPDHDALRQFNKLLQALASPNAPLDSDQLATAARELVVNDNRPAIAPRCIQQRMRRGAAIDLMADDPDWENRDETAAGIARLVTGYLRDRRAVIPNTVPVVGRLDDAIVVEAAWPAVAAEVRKYLEFCRIRHVEAQLRGESGRHFGFTREQWPAAMHAEAGWIEHCELVGEASYVPGDPTPAFRVH